MGYEFIIRECENGWLLKRTISSGWEYFDTLNKLTQSLLWHVDQDCPRHRKTGARINRDKYRGPPQELGK